jgi:hypothetical protein
MRRPLIRILRATLVAFILVNAIVFWHTWRMTHFVPPGTEEESSTEASGLGRIAMLFQGVKVFKSVIPMPAPVLSMPARTVSFMTRDGLELAAWDIPAIAPRGVVIVFHGYAGSRWGLMSEARVLHDLGWRTLLVDFRGCGDSDGFATTLGWDEARDVAAATSWARHEWPEAALVLYGKSMGAVAVMRAVATEGVRPDGIILECPFDKLVTMIGRYYQVINLPAFPLAQLSLVWGGVQHGFNPFRHNPVTYAAAVTCPALLLNGNNDPWVKPDETRRVAAAMRGPTECHIFKDGGHADYWRDVPEEYRQVLGVWLNQKIGTEK